jgi:hypothetical protein
MRLETELHRANECYLALMADSARQEALPQCVLVGELRSRLVGLTEAARIRAGARPYLLMDVRFNEVVGGAHQDMRNEAVELARRVLWLLWYAVRFQPPRVSIRLGVSPPLARRMTESSLETIEAIVEAGGAMLYPRWPEKLRFWRRLLEGAGIDDANVLQSVDLHAAQLLAGELMGRAV